MKTFEITNSYGWTGVVVAENLDQAMNTTDGLVPNFYTEGRYIKSVVDKSVKVEDIKLGDRISARWTKRGYSFGTVTKINKAKFIVTDTTQGDCTTLNKAGFIGLVVYAFKK